MELNIPWEGGVQCHFSVPLGYTAYNFESVHEHLSCVPMYMVSSYPIDAGVYIRSPVEKVHFTVGVSGP